MSCSQAEPVRWPSNHALQPHTKPNTNPCLFCSCLLCRPAAAAVLMQQVAHSLSHTARPSPYCVLPVQSRTAGAGQLQPTAPAAASLPVPTPACKHPAVLLNLIKQIGAGSPKQLCSRERGLLRAHVHRPATAVSGNLPLAMVRQPLDLTLCTPNPQVACSVGHIHCPRSWQAAPAYLRLLVDYVQ